MLLKRYAYATSYLNMIPRFAGLAPQMCLVVNKSTKIATENWSHLLPDFNQKWLSLANLQYMLTISMQLEYHWIIAGGLLMRQFDLFADKELDKGKVTMVTRTSIFKNSPRGFVDGTVQPVCWTGAGQRQVFNNYKKVHSLKFQSVAVSNYVIANI